MRVISTTIVAFLLMMSAVEGGEAFTYSSAYENATKNGKPLLVMIGKEDCKYCEQMRTQVIPQLQKTGALKNVAFAMVDAEKHTKLASKLVRGSSVPQLVIYTRVGAGWNRRQLEGLQTAASVKKMIDAPVMQTTFLNRNTGYNNNNTTRRSGRVCFT